MEKAISEIVGRVSLDGGGSTELYRALRLLLCATCGAEISEGTLFTRRRVKGIALRIMPRCPKCAPFTLPPEKKEKSALLQSLLKESPAESAGRAGVSSKNVSQSQQEEKKLAKKVRSRLEPALKRRRKRDEG